MGHLSLIVEHWLIMYPTFSLDKLNYSLTPSRNKHSQIRKFVSVSKMFRFWDVHISHWDLRLKNVQTSKRRTRKWYYELLVTYFHSSNTSSYSSTCLLILKKLLSWKGNIDWNHFILSTWKFIQPKSLQPSANIELRDLKAYHIIVLIPKYPQFWVTEWLLSYLFSLSPPLFLLTLYLFLLCLYEHYYHNKTSNIKTYFPDMMFSNKSHSSP